MQALSCFVSWKKWTEPSSEADTTQSPRPAETSGENTDLDTSDKEDIAGINKTR